MGTVWQLLLGLLAVAIATLVTGDVCPYEVCQCTSSTIDCRNKGLSTLPPLKKGIFTQTTLDISDNNITSIADGQLPPGLEHLTSHKTPLAAIDDNAFNDSLTCLDLSSNHLTHIPDLGHMTKLQQLYIGSNQITDSATASLPDSLTLLRLPANSLTEIPRVVSGLSRLTTLSLYGNIIHSIDSFTFPSSLQWLDLSSNQIENISSISFSQNTSELTVLYLYSNPLKHIANDAFTQLSKLTFLYLLYTRLTRLPLALRSLTHLTHLYLNYIPTLICTCQESALVPWYNNLTSLTISSGSHCDVDYFLGHLAQNCPKP